jgi:hypothetical protein
LIVLDYCWRRLEEVRGWRWCWTLGGGKSNQANKQTLQNDHSKSAYLYQKILSQGLIKCLFTGQERFQGTQIGKSCAHKQGEKVGRFG